MYDPGAGGVARLAMRSRFRPSNPLNRTTLLSPTQRTHTSTFSSKSSKRTTSFTFASHNRPAPSRKSTILQRLRTSIRSLHNSRARLNSKPTSPNPTPTLNSSNGSAAAAEPTSLGGRLRKLSREYGWAALGVYLGLSAIDFPLCYLLVSYLGTDRIGKLISVTHGFANARRCHKVRLHTTQQLYYCAL